MERPAVQEILAVEALPDADYPAAAEAFVRRFLPPGEGRRRLSMPGTYRGLVHREGWEDPLLDFAELVPDAGP
jgi:hypothetical protein